MRSFLAMCQIQKLILDGRIRLGIVFFWECIDGSQEFYGGERRLKLNRKREILRSRAHSLEECIKRGRRFRVPILPATAIINLILISQPIKIHRTFD